MGYMKVNLPGDTDIPAYLSVLKQQNLERINLLESILYPTISAVGILANVFVIVVILVWEKNRSNRSVTQLFAVNLAFADLVFVCTLPFNNAAVMENWTYGDLFCKLKKGIDHLNFHASILFLTVMSVDRLLATVYLIRMRIYRTRKNALYACMLVWLFALLTSSPYGFYARVSRLSEQHLVGSGQGLCGIAFPSDHPDIIMDEDYLANANLSDFFSNMNLTSSHYLGDYISNLTDAIDTSGFLFDDDDYANADADAAAAADDEPYTAIEVGDCRKDEGQQSSSYLRYMWFKFVLFYVIPVIAIIGSYTTIIYTATKRLKRMPENQQKMRQHMVVTIAAMVFTFIICWSPILIWNLVVTVSYVEMNTVLGCDMVQCLFQMLAYSNSAINPMLYWLTSKSFRQKIRAVYEYVTTGRHLRSLVVMKREDSVNTRTTSARIFREPSTKTLPSREGISLLQLQPVAEEKNEEAAGDGEKSLQTGTKIDSLPSPGGSKIDNESEKLLSSSSK